VTTHARAYGDDVRPVAPFAGQTVRIRFAEVDHQFFFQGSVDAVSIASQALPPGSRPPTAGGEGGRLLGNGGGCFDVPPVQSVASGRIRAFAGVATRRTTV
jgi:hypothetical protein